MWLFVNNQLCFGYIQITTLKNKNTFGAPYNHGGRKATDFLSYCHLREEQGMAQW